MKRCKICNKVLGLSILIDKNGEEIGLCDKCNLQKCFDKMAEEEKEAEDLKKQDIQKKIPITHTIRADEIMCDEGRTVIDVKEFVDYISNELDVIKANQQKILSAITE